MGRRFGAFSVFSYTFCDRMRCMKTLIRNATIIPMTERNLFFRGDILIKDGIISRVEPSITEEADEIIDASEMIALPSFVNAHTHLSMVLMRNYKDTAENLGLALRIDGELYPLRDTAYKSLLDRAKIGGTALPKLERGVLAQTLNACLKLYSSEALALIRDEKVAAVHSGDQKDYSVLSIDALLQALKLKLDARFPDNEFEQGYSDHSISSASWRLPKQKDGLLGVYTGLL